MRAMIKRLAGVDKWYIKRDSPGNWVAYKSSAWWSGIPDDSRREGSAGWRWNALSAPRWPTWAMARYYMYMCWYAESQNACLDVSKDENDFAGNGGIILVWRNNSL